jgi:hypothetical protein
MIYSLFTVMYQLNCYLISSKFEMKQIRFTAVCKNVSSIIYYYYYYYYTLSHLHPAARQFCRSTYTITDITIK